MDENSRGGEGEGGGGGGNELLEDLGGWRTIGR